ncbi:MAG: protein translocase subunit SecD [Patescibacteria group bacterium]|jgi:preprotein translocase subunit SecD
MKNNLLFWVSILSGIFLWIAIPATSFPLPGTSRKVVLKTENPSFNILGLKISIPNQLRFGLDLQGGSHLVFELDTKKTPSSDVVRAVDAARDNIEKRINLFGVSEASVVVLKNNNVYRVAVDIPGKKNPQEAIDLIGKVAQLEFGEYAVQKVQQGTQSADIPYFTKTKLTGNFLKKTQLVFDQQTGKPQISLLFNSEGTKLFAELTKKNLNKPLGIILDGQVITAPVVQQEIKTGEAVITGTFTIEEGNKIVNALNAGSLPVPVKLVEQRTVEATLGKSNIQKSILAGALGLLFVSVFMVVLYGKEGLVALVSLAIYTIFSVALYKLFGIVLTLSGIAGFILSIGMAVDANILIYERIKEEKLVQKSQQKAIVVGYFSALSAIKAANINTLLVCFVLFNPFNFAFLPLFGMVRGFALTLAIGVLLSLFTGVFITKNILWKLYKISSL